MEEVGEKMEEKVWQYMQEYHMVAENDRIVAGISGGGDSMALLFLLQKLQNRCNFQFCAVHVNHGIRGEEASLDEKLVEDYCAKHQIPYYAFHYQVPKIAREKGWSEEEAGRQMRHVAYDHVLKTWKGNKIALAHHQNDQAETVLYHLARGCGIRGLSGMLPVQGIIIRPLLCIERKEIDHYLSENQIPYRTDSSNLSDQYVRNRIRRHVVGYLEENVNQRTVEHLAKTAGIAAQVEAYMSAQARKVLQLYAQNLDDAIQISNEIGKEAPIIQNYAVLEALEQLCGQRKDLSGDHLEKILDLFQKETGKQVNIYGKITAHRVYGGVLLEKYKKERQNLELCEWNLPVPGRIQCKEGLWETRIFLYKSQNIPEKTYTKWFDYDRIKTTLQIRNRRPGDYLVVTSKGGKKKLKDYLIDEKIPRLERDHLMLLASGQEILWIVGKRISEAYKITESTKRVLEIKYQGGWGSE